MGEVGGHRNDKYDVSQVCYNGHVITEYFNTYPQHCLNYCGECGEKTITSCQICHGAIRVAYLDGYPGFKEPSAPSYCTACGAAHPWTERAIQSATELWVEESQASADEAFQFQEILSDLTKDSPRTPLAASRFKGAMTKVGSGVANAIRDIAVNVMSEAAKKSIGM